MNSEKNACYHEVKLKYAFTIVLLAFFTLLPLVSATTDTVTNGDTGASINYIAMGKITASASGSTSTVGVNIQSSGGNGRVAIYDVNASGAPDNLLGESASVSISSTGWFDIALTGVSLNASTDYWLAVQVDTANTYYDSGLAYDAYWKAQAYGAFPNPIISPPNSNPRFALRVTYASAPTANITYNYTQTRMWLNNSEGYFSCNYPCNNINITAQSNHTGTINIYRNYLIPDGQKLLHSAVVTAPFNRTAYISDIDDFSVTLWNITAQLIPDDAKYNASNATHYLGVLSGLLYPQIYVNNSNIWEYLYPTVTNVSCSVLSYQDTASCQISRDNIVKGSSETVLLTPNLYNYTSNATDGDNNYTTNSSGQSRRLAINDIPDIKFKFNFTKIDGNYNNIKAYDTATDGTNIYVIGTSSSNYEIIKYDVNGNVLNRANGSVIVDGAGIGYSAIDDTIVISIAGTMKKYYSNLTLKWSVGISSNLEYENLDVDNSGNISVATYTGYSNCNARLIRVDKDGSSICTFTANNGCDGGTLNSIGVTPITTNNEIWLFGSYKIGFSYNGKLWRLTPNCTLITEKFIGDFVRPNDATLGLNNEVLVTGWGGLNDKLDLWKLNSSGDIINSSEYGSDFTASGVQYNPIYNKIYVTGQYFKMYGIGDVRAYYPFIAEYNYNFTSFDKLIIYNFTYDYNLGLFGSAMASDYSIYSAVDRMTATRQLGIIKFSQVQPKGSVYPYVLINGSRMFTYPSNTWLNISCDYTSNPISTEPSCIISRDGVQKGTSEIVQLPTGVYSIRANSSETPNFTANSSGEIIVLNITPFVNYTYLTIAENPYGCGIYTPSLGTHQYLLNQSVNISAMPICNFTYWLLNNGTNITNTQFVLKMDYDYTATAYYTGAIQNQSADVGGGVKTPYFFLDFFFTGYFITGMFNIAIGGLAVYFTKNFFYGIGVFFLFFLVFLVGGLYPSILWAVVIFITALIVTYIIGVIRK